MDGERGESQDRAPRILAGRRGHFGDHPENERRLRNRGGDDVIGEKRRGPERDLDDKHRRDTREGERYGDRKEFDRDHRLLKEDREGARESGAGSRGRNDRVKDDRPRHERGTRDGRGAREEKGHLSDRAGSRDRSQRGERMTRDGRHRDERETSRRGDVETSRGRVARDEGMRSEKGRDGRSRDVRYRDDLEAGYARLSRSRRDERDVRERKGELYVDYRNDGKVRTGRDRGEIDARSRGDHERREGEGSRRYDRDEDDRYERDRRGNQYERLYKGSHEGDPEDDRPNNSRDHHEPADGLRGRSGLTGRADRRLDWSEERRSDFDRGGTLRMAADKYGSGRGGIDSGGRGDTESSWQDRTGDGDSRRGWGGRDTFSRETGRHDEGYIVKDLGADPYSAAACDGISSLADELLNMKFDTTGRLIEFKKDFYHPHPATDRMSENQAERERQKLDIHVLFPGPSSGVRVPKPVLTFEQAAFPEVLTDQLASRFSKPTAIQVQGWPIALSGHNMIGIAETGSGKTLAFILPALVHIAAQPPLQRGEGPVVLVLAPTRELADQIGKEATLFAGFVNFKCVTLYGQCENVGQRISQLASGAHIVVGAPGKLMDFLKRGHFNCRRVTYFVLDEADRLLELNFGPQVLAINSLIRPDRQVLMWSATWPDEVQSLAQAVFPKATERPYHICVGKPGRKTVDTITQYFVFCQTLSERDAKFFSHVKETATKLTLVFVNMKSTADELGHMLPLRTDACVYPAVLHGGKEQNQRQEAIEAFRKHRKNCLVATEVASRGLDVPQIAQVINYDCPREIDDYIHRIGRTGRAGQKGKAITYILPQDYINCRHFFSNVVELLKRSQQEVPPELMQFAGGGYVPSFRFGGRGDARRGGGFGIGGYAGSTYPAYGLTQERSSSAGYAGGTTVSAVPWNSDDTESRGGGGRGRSDWSSGGAAKRGAHASNGLLDSEQERRREVQTETWEDDSVDRRRGTDSQRKPMPHNNWNAEGIDSRQPWNSTGSADNADVQRFDFGAEDEGKTLTATNSRSAVDVPGVGAAAGARAQHFDFGASDAAGDFEEKTVWDTYGSSDVPSSNTVKSQWDSDATPAVVGKSKWEVDNESSAVSGMHGASAGDADCNERNQEQAESSTGNSTRSGRTPPPESDWDCVAALQDQAPIISAWDADSGVVEDTKGEVGESSSMNSEKQETNAELTVDYKSKEQDR